MDEYVAEVLPRGCRLEAPPPSEHLTISWGNGEWVQACNGFRMDGQWEYQRVRREGSTREPHCARTCRTWI